MVGKTAYLLVVSSALGVNSVPELVALLPDVRVVAFTTRVGHFRVVVGQKRILPPALNPFVTLMRFPYRPYELHALAREQLLTKAIWTFWLHLKTLR
jgi:hypothetical protein